MGVSPISPAIARSGKNPRPSRSTIVMGAISACAVARTLPSRPRSQPASARCVVPVPRPAYRVTFAATAARTRRTAAAVVAALMRNTETASASRLACSSMERAAALASSTSAAFCCVVSSICTTAWLTCSMPELCSAMRQISRP